MKANTDVIVRPASDKKSWAMVAVLVLFDAADSSDGIDQQPSILISAFVESIENTTDILVLRSEKKCFPQVLERVKKSLSSADISFNNIRRQKLRMRDQELVQH